MLPVYIHNHLGANDREFGDELAFDAEAHTGATHQHIQDLVKRPDVVNCNEGAVVAGHGVPFQCRACSHQGTHGGHDIQLLDGIEDLVYWVVLWEFVAEVVNVTLDCLRPGLTTLLGVNPSGVPTLVDVFLKGGGEVLVCCCHLIESIPAIKEPIPPGIQVQLVHDFPEKGRRASQ